MSLPSVDINSLHPFGCLVWYKVPEANRKKLDPKGRASILLSYLSDGNGFRLWDLENRITLKSRDVLFNDTVFPYGSNLLPPSSPDTSVKIAWPVSSPPSLPTPFPIPSPPEALIAPPTVPPAQDASFPHAPPSDIRPIILPAPTFRYPSAPAPPSSQAASPPRPRPTAITPSPLPAPPPRRSGRERRAPDRYGQWSKKADLSPPVDTPKTWRQLLKSPNKARWLRAADDEFALLLGMQTWNLVPRPAKRRIIKSKWVFKVKRQPDNTIQKLKARLVAMGYSQVHGTDYDEVFSPTLRLETLRLILSLLAANDWKGRQVDFKTAFLNGHLDSPIYMEQPPGFEDPTHPDWVCEVNRSLYGLKQLPRQWNIELHKAFIDIGWINSKYDPTLYFKLDSGRLVGALTTHVDDLAIVGEPAVVDSIISAIGKRFTIGANDELNHFLSLKITRDVLSKHVFLTQSHYISELGSRFLDGGHISVSTPTDVSFKNLGRRLPTENPSPGPYPQLIGSLLWVSQYWAEDRDDRRSTSAYTYRIGDGAISWKSRKQATVSLSSTEAEYKALSDSCKEGLWLRHLLTKLRLRPDSAIPLHVDNEGAKALAKNPEHHAQTKHIHARYHFIRDCVQDDEIILLHVSTTDMLADMLTKPLARVALENHRQMFGLI
ncbi:hypothetical protein PCASD_15893 [Puccinia coronata f. sp. avenae]|uniref:Uncharacterized protein n=1 Tax=Puccinia coronata f. sp. avenae TaxID=200324 RepID=A0A2N5TA99_9BASI|nr:hypothetical protein PCASD_15893 [Puccinia coronata f. sp. avenae]